MNTERWNRHVRVGRLQLRVCVMRHRYSSPSPDRWVVQTGAIWDRKRASAPEGESDG
jgi:hypothetical protein